MGELRPVAAQRAAWGDFWSDMFERVKMQSIRSSTKSRARTTVSVALCTYNGARYLRAQLWSIASQTLLPDEVVVCDDLSTDETASILERFRQEAPFTVRVYVNSEQLRTTANFEKAMRLCTGEFIALSDQDDLWDPTKLEKLVALIKSDVKVQLVFSDALLMNDSSELTGRRLWQDFRFTAEKQRSFIVNPISTLLRHDIVTGATAMVRASLLETFEEIPPSWLHDGWLAWMAAIHGGVQIASEPLTLYRIHPSQQVGTGRTSMIKKLRSIRSLERARYQGVADQCTHLLAYLESSRTASPGLLQNVQRKRAFLEGRSRITSNVFRKLYFLTTNLHSYLRYARGVFSMRKDVLL